MFKEEILTIGKYQAKVLINKSANKTKSIALFLPGVSGGALDDRFDSLAKACVDKNIDIARIEIWEDVQALENINIKTVSNVLDEVISQLKEYGYEIFFGIGKSFGGTILLINNHPDISKFVLWAPVIGLVEKSANISAHFETELSEVDSLLDLTVDNKFLSKVNKPTLIIQGSVDEIMPMENSKKMANSLPEGEITTIENMGHSYDNLVQEQEVLEKTVSFLESGYSN